MFMNSMLVRMKINPGQSGSILFLWWDDCEHRPDQIDPGQFSENLPL